jgi:phage terminase large subunit-like protein
MLSTTAKDIIRTKFQAMSKNEKGQFLAGLPDEIYEEIRFFSDIMLRDSQIVVPGNWRYWLFVGGRGTGKSFTGAAEIRKRVYKKQEGLCVIASTEQELIKVMIPAIIKEFPFKHRPVYVSGAQKLIKCHNGVTIDCRTSQQGSIRGPNYTFVWLDELVKCWDENAEKIEKNFRVLDASIRKSNAQILITTTGERWSIFRRWYDMFNAGKKIIQIRTGKMTDNEYISAQAIKDMYDQYGNSRYEDLELNGVINFEVEGALWSNPLINRTRKVSIEEVANPPNPNNMKRYANPLDFFIKFIIGADPATTSHANSDPWGIVVLGLGRDNHIYVLEDRSKILSPNDAADEIMRLHHKYRQAMVVAESNQGGDMITYILRTKMPNLMPKLVHAHQNKMTRAQPICILFDQDRAHIVGNMKELEEEMCEYNGDPLQKSPNRLDAMVHGAQQLLLEKNVRPITSNWSPKF